jgi:cation:H+ antiporter
MPSAPPRARRRDLVWFAAAVALPVPWVVAESLGGLGIDPLWVAVLAGLAILGAAFMLSWSCEVAERDIPQALALLVLALVGVLPEYAVDLTFAWRAGADPEWAQYAVANMTGANRLLIGVGWTCVVLVGCRAGGTSSLRVDPSQRLEIRFLIWATLYSFLIPLNGQIDWFDAVVLFALFGAYVAAAIRGHEESDEELLGPALLIDLHFSTRARRWWAMGLFVAAAYAIFVSAEPFAEGLVHVGRSYQIDEFLLVQWVAPLASESPEFVVAILFAMRLRGSVGIGALVSSKVNQWTLLVGSLPIAFMLSASSWSGLPLDERQTQELFLTSAQSLFAAILISDLDFSRRKALVLFLLFALQFSQPESHGVFTWIYLGLSLGYLAVGPPSRRSDFFRLATSWPGALGSASKAAIETGSSRGG